ncbi:MAG: nucleotide exchange factor GrpE [Ruminococcus sp.]|nr:nucleotide exchange factor GrpE [Ruminococcus sp.]MBR1764447.1 nucleotide exchange factor GrpE [Ruminococcus sp.]
MTQEENEKPVTQEEEKTEAEQEAPEQEQPVSDNAEENKEEAEQEQEDNKPTEEEKLRAQLEEQNDKYLRLMAEYDNFRKRSAKERLELSATVKGDTVAEILPLIDNFERALRTETADTAYKSGVEMIFKQFSDMLTKLGVEVIDPTGQEFDPNIANAVSQVEDPELGENIVAQTFSKGYKIGEKIIRYAMVAVANP